MELSRAVASTALILGVLLIVGHARGDGEAAEPAKETAQKKIDKREEARRAALIEHQRRAETFDRECRKPVMSAEELETCRAAYRKM
jgi:hypothetical protein